MRLFLLILAICLTLPAVGCNSDLKCRRETALLRAEYLDLEDKYYALMSEIGSTTNGSAAALPASSSEVFVASSQPVIYGAGIEQPMGSTVGTPEIIYYDQNPEYLVDGQPYYQSNYNLTPTPATPAEQQHGTSLRSSQSADDPQGTYYPSPVENQPIPQTTAEPSADDVLPAPDSTFDGAQDRFDLGIEEAHEAGHEIKIEMSSPITEVVINKSLSQGKNTDGRPGDDGIEVLIQPKSADGTVVDEAGNLTVSLIDPSADQGERQIGQWTFLQEEAELFFAEDEFDNRGILLNLSWDKIVPTHKRLTVYVRFETSDGRVMESTSDLFIDPPNDLAFVEAQENDDLEFVRIDEDEEQGWYQSQRSGSQRNSDLNWGRSNSNARSNAGAFGRRSQKTPRQSKWRPAR